MLVAKLIRTGGYIALLNCFKLNGELGSTGIQYTVGKLGSTRIWLGSWYYFTCCLAFVRSLSTLKCILCFEIGALSGDFTICTM